VSKAEVNLADIKKKQLLPQVNLQLNLSLLYCDFSSLIYFIYQFLYNDAIRISDYTASKDIMISE
jgi:hypothetical protein